MAQVDFKAIAEKDILPHFANDDQNIVRKLLYENGRFSARAENARKSMERYAALFPATHYCTAMISSAFMSVDFARFYWIEHTKQFGAQQKRAH